MVIVAAESHTVNRQNWVAKTIWSSRKETQTIKQQAIIVERNLFCKHAVYREKSGRNQLVLKKKRDEKREKTKLKTNNTSLKSKPQILKQDIYFHSFTFCTVECIFAVMNVLLEVGILVMAYRQAFINNTWTGMLGPYILVFLILVWSQ